MNRFPLETCLSAEVLLYCKTHLSSGCQTRLLTARHISDEVQQRVVLPRENLFSTNSSPETDDVQQGCCHTGIKTMHFTCINYAVVNSHCMEMSFPDSLYAQHKHVTCEYMIMLINIRLKILQGTWFCR